MGATGSDLLQIVPRFSDGNSYNEVNSNSPPFAVSYNTAAFFTVSRIDENGFGVYRNELLSHRVNNPSEMAISVAIQLNGKASTGGPAGRTAHTAAAYFIASGVTATEEASKFSILQTLETDLNNANP